MWITCGLLWCFYQLFWLWFWWHPFTAEDPLVSKWCNSKFFQICSDEETNSSTSWMARGWVNFYFWLNYSNEISCLFSLLLWSYACKGRSVLLWEQIDYSGAVCSPCVVPPPGQVVALCFVLVLGSLAPCLPELSLYSSSLSSSSSHTVKSAPLPSGDLYTTSQGMFHPCP